MLSQIGFRLVSVCNWILRADKPTCMSAFGTELVCKLGLRVFKISRALYYCKVPKRVTKQAHPKFIFRRITEVTWLHRGLCHWQGWRQGTFSVEGGLMQFSECFYHLRPQNCIWLHVICVRLLEPALVSIWMVGKTESQIEIPWLV